jgi:BON domain
MGPAPGFHQMENVAAKKLALLAAAEIQSVERIVDPLKVDPAEKLGDAEIRDHEGLAPVETMKQLAERDAWCVVGVKQVVNRIEVSGKQQEAC